ncbi:MAG: FAD binding domain-containing protein [Alphaproteobacteria bacterium]|nr:FAD binding domain-containing protein [Alphaproteobacteria bacterium]
MVAFHRPDTLDEALALRASRDVMIVAGATDVYPARTGRLAWGDPTHKDLLDLTGIAGLDRIEESAQAYRFGCLVTWTDLARAALPAQFAGYQQAAREIGGQQVQNRATLVGNICTASPAGDGVPNLLVLDATVELTSKSGVRHVPIASFIDGYRHTACRSDEIVTALIVPKLGGARSEFRKLGARKYLVISIAMVAALIALDAEGKLTDVRIAVGACSAIAQRLTALERELAGTPLARAAERVTPVHLAALKPIDDVRGSAAYRLASALTLVRDTLSGLAAGDVRRVA